MSPFFVCGILCRPSALNSPMMPGSHRLLAFVLFLPLFATAQLTCQPMVGHTGLTNARIWVQGDGVAKVHLEYWADSLERSPQNTSASEHLLLSPSQGHSAIFDLGNMEPGTQYRFRVFFGTEMATQGADTAAMTFKTQPLWQYRFDPPPFKLALGSCSFINETAYDRPGRPYGGGYEIFDGIANENPDLMLWLGDNVYFREVDWASQSGILHRYNHMRSLPELQTLLGACPHYAIWDDHDFGPDNSDGSWIHKDWSEAAFSHYWPNPTQGLPDANGHGITTAFQFHDVDFFLLDNRYFRINHENQTHEPQVLGQVQLDWLIQALQASRAPFKVVAMGGQMLSSYAKYENMAQFPKERDAILQRIEKEDIRGVVFLSGDRHSTELSEVELNNGRKVIDFTCSALTSGTHDNTSESNIHRVEGTMVGIRNYGTIEVTGPRKSREMTLRAHDSSGRILWEHKYAASDL